MMSNNIKGAGLMVGSMTAFTINDTCIKLIGHAIPLFEILFVRNMLSSAMLLALAIASGTLDFAIPRKDAWLIFWRCVAEVVAAYCFMTALINMPLANLSAILQALPLTVTAGAALFLREHVGWRRMAAIGSGFVGMLLIVRPGAEGFNVFALYALGAVASVTVRDLVVRGMSHRVSSMTVSFVTALVVGIAAGGLSLGTEWVAIDGRSWVLIGMSSVLIVVAYFCSVAVMRVGDVSFVAPFRYTSLLVALIAGLFVFGHWPDPLTLMGAAIIVGSGIFTLYRERVRQDLR